MRFFGVRGSCPCSSPAHLRYGGNTSCVLVEPDHGPGLILDLGTGLRPLGDVLEAAGDSSPVTALLSHLHWDHMIGLPFFAPVLRPGSTMDVYGPPQQRGSLHQVVDQVVQPPFFPVQVQQLHGSITFHEVVDDKLLLGDCVVVVRQVPHLGTSLGFRVEADGAAVAYVSDHQAPGDLAHVEPGVLELCDGADLVIHDAQYSDEEFAAKPDWGHSTVGYAVHVAAEAGARELALFHHDPSHLDDDIDRLVEGARRRSEAARLQRVLGAAEGLALHLGGR